MSEAQQKAVRDYTEDKKKLIGALKRPQSLSALMKILKIEKYELLGLLQEINEEGIYEIIGDADRYMLNKSALRSKRTYTHSFGDVQEFQFLILSDSHMGSIYEQVEYLKFLYKEAKRRGIKNVYHIGDITDGYYTNRPQQVYALKALGFDAQAEHVIKNYPYEKGITTYFILGNHDETHIRNGGADIGIAISRARPDLKYLGVGSARIMLTPKCSMDMLHPLDGSSYALSYAGQKFMDALTGGDKPNILLVGHHHKALYMFYRNIHYFEVPSTCLQSDWEKRKRINNVAGAWILNIKVDERGTIISLTSELIPHFIEREDQEVE